MPNLFHMVYAKFHLVLRPISHGNPAMPFCILSEVDLYWNFPAAKRLILAWLKNVLKIILKLFEQFQKPTLQIWFFLKVVFKNTKNTLIFGVFVGFGSLANFLSFLVDNNRRKNWKTPFLRLRSYETWTSININIGLKKSMSNSTQILKLKPAT